MKVPNFACNFEPGDEHKVKGWKNHTPELNRAVIDIFLERLSIRGIEIPEETKQLHIRALFQLDNWFVMHELAHHFIYLIVPYLETHPKDEMYRRLPEYKKAHERCLASIEVVKAA